MTVMSYVKLMLQNKVEVIINNEGISAPTNKFIGGVLNTRYRFDIEDSKSPSIPDSNMYIARLILKDFSNSKIVEHVKPEYVPGRVY